MPPLTGAVFSVPSHTKMTEAFHYQYEVRGKMESVRVRNALYIQWYRRIHYAPERTPSMDKHFETIIAKATKAQKINEIEVIQELWSGYGQIIRYETSNPEIPTVIAKHISFPGKRNHPRGMNSDRSHKRKLKSYKVETQFYEQWSKKCLNGCRVPRCLASEGNKSEMLIVLEDLDNSGFPHRKRWVTEGDVQVGLDWLAQFHATFLGEQPDGLWKNGTYWHLDTRPDELDALSDERLRNAARKIDEALKNCRFKTFVHGDAKLANFCFAPDGFGIAAVDFQYVGGGCGMKDVAYFAGSCYHDNDIESSEADILNYYFAALKDAVAKRTSTIDFSALEAEWRRMYPFAWADFHRFLKGWSPGSWRNSSYSERVTAQVIADLGL